MPLYNFHIVSDVQRECVGSINLSDTGSVIPAGLKLATRLLAGVAFLHCKDAAWIIEATDSVGALVYSFTFSRNVGDGPQGYVH